MSLPRQIRHRMAASARWKAARNKPVTRRDAEAFAGPIRKALLELLSGEVAELEGYAVQWDAKSGTWERIDWCLNGHIELMRLIDPAINTVAMKELSRKLDAQELLTAAEVEAALRELRAHCEAFTTITLDQLLDKVRTCEIGISLEFSGIKEAA